MKYIFIAALTAAGSSSFAQEQNLQPVLNYVHWRNHYFKPPMKQRVLLVSESETDQHHRRRGLNYLVTRRVGAKPLKISVKEATHATRDR